MSEPQTLGARLRMAMASQRFKNADVAKAAGVHVKTVSQWLSDRQAPEAEALDAVARLLGVSAGWIRYGEEASHTGPSRVSEARIPSIPQGLPKSVRVYMQQFLLELAEADVSDREIEEARRSLTSPENYTFYVGGNPVEYSEEDALLGVQAFALAIRGILRERGYTKLKSK